jgi:N-methylhydantoinase B/oxoprolinase/acetone carboxylase alpha subunit
MRNFAVGPLFAIIVLSASLLSAEAARADTSSDCGRFFLRKKERAPSVSATDIRNQQGAVQRIINQVQNILSAEDLGAEQERRAQQLIAEARQRVEAIRRQTTQLRQEQIAYAQEIQTAARQRVQQQVELSRSLEQQQRDLSRQLEARQRQLQQSLERQSQRNQLTR